MSYSIPESFLKLHNGEEFLRQESFETILKNKDLHDHMKMIEQAMNILDYYAQHYEHEDEDQLTIQLLGIRQFNAYASSIKLMFSGYYQTSAGIMRDILETIFFNRLFSF